MSKVADYVVISDGKVLLNSNVDFDHDFPINLVGVNVGMHSILSFMVHGVGAQNLLFQLSIINGNNGTIKVGTYGINSPVECTFQEVISEKILAANTNTLRVKWLAGIGTLEISDIVLWYRKDV